MGIAVERLAPDAVLASTNLSGTVSEIQDDPDAPDSNSIDAISATALSDIRVSFPTPTNAVIAGAGLQEFRTKVESVGGGFSTGSPTYQVHVYEAGVLKISGPVVTIAAGNDGRAVQSLLWDITALDPALIECRIQQLTLGGTGGNRRSIGIMAVEWNSTYDIPGGWGVRL